MSIEALINDNYPEGIVKLVTGRIAPNAVNVADYVATRKE